MGAQASAISVDPECGRPHYQLIGVKSSHFLLGLLRNHPSRDVGAPYSKPEALCSPLGLCWYGVWVGSTFFCNIWLTQVVIEFSAVRLSFSWRREQVMVCGVSRLLISFPPREGYLRQKRKPRDLTAIRLFLRS